MADGVGRAGGVPDAAHGKRDDARHAALGGYVELLAHAVEGCGDEGRVTRVGLFLPGK